MRLQQTCYDGFISEDYTFDRLLPYVGLKKALIMSYSRSRAFSDREGACDLCCEIPERFCLPQCGHRICSSCYLHLKLLSKRTTCPLCKAEYQRVYVVPPDVENLAHVDHRAFKVHDKQTDLNIAIGLLCYNKDDLAIVKRVLSPTCRSCGEECPSVSALKAHLKSAHKQFLCDICCKHQSLFVGEQKPMSRDVLKRHNDSEHPTCKFCRKSFYSDDTLFEHLNKEHFTCYICKERGALYQFYADEHNLRAHQKKEHFVCDDPDCSFIAFASSIDLKLHRVKVHGEGRDQSSRSSARGRGKESTTQPRRQHSRGRREDGQEDELSLAAKHERALENAKDGTARRRPRQPGQVSYRADDSISVSAAPGPARSERVPRGRRESEEEEDEEKEETERSAAAAVTVGRSEHIQDGPSSDGHRAERVQRREPGPSPQEIEVRRTRSRNRILTERIRNALEHDDVLFERFRDLSSYFRLGDLTAEIYYERVADQLGADAQDIMVELIDLLPDEDKKQKLLTAHRKHLQRQQMIHAAERSQRQEARSPVQDGQRTSSRISRGAPVVLEQQQVSPARREHKPTTRIVHNGDVESTAYRAAAVSNEVEAGTDQSKELSTLERRRQRRQKRLQNS